MKIIPLEKIRTHYDRLSPLYARYWGPHIHHGFWKSGESTEQAQIQLMEELARETAIPRGARVLDIGCGFGGSSLWLAEKFNCSVHGITLSPVQQAAAQKTISRRKLSNQVQIEVMDANHLSFPKESFDVIWIIECSEHLENKKNFFERCARILKPGGVIGVCAWLEGDHAEDSKDQILIRKIQEAMLCPSFGKFADYQKWLTQAGLKLQTSRDITAQVIPTWTNCLKILKRLEVRAFLAMSDRATKDFAASFDLMKQGFETGAMRYGLFSAEKM